MNILAIPFLNIYLSVRVRACVHMCATNFLVLDPHKHLTTTRGDLVLTPAGCEGHFLCAPTVSNTSLLYGLINLWL